MSECTDREIGRLLHAYELEVLGEDDRRAFEAHVYECDFCLSRLSRFEQAARHLKFDPEVRAAVAGLDGDIEAKPRARRWPARSILAAAAVLVILLLQPWNISIDTTNEVIADVTRVAVAPFEDLTAAGGTGRLGLIITNLLISDLSESQYVRAISSQKFDDALADSHATTGPSISPLNLLDAARKAGARWLVVGNVVARVPTLVVAIQLVAVNTGDVVWSDRIIGDEGDDVFVLVDHLTPRIRDGLALPAAANDELDRPVAGFTTRSVEAYNMYLQGLEHRDRLELDAAAACFRRAVSLDTTFAMAYYNLVPYTKGPEQNRMLAAALRHMDQAGRMDRFFIRAEAAILSGDRESALAELTSLVTEYPDEERAFYTLGTMKLESGSITDAIADLRRATVLNPRFKKPYNQLAYAYFATGQADSAFASLDRYAALAPDEPNPHDSRGELLAQQGRLSEAIAAYRQALLIDSTFQQSRLQLGCLLLLSDRDSLSTDVFRPLMEGSDKTLASRLRGFLVAPLIRHGQFAEALETLDSLIVRDQSDGDHANLITKRFAKALLLTTLDSFPAALAELDQCIMLHTALRPDDHLSYYHYRAEVLALKGELVEAERIAEDLKANLPDRSVGLLGYDFIMGVIEMQRGQPEQAILHLGRIPEGALARPTGYWLGRAYLAAGRFDDAVAHLESYLRPCTPDRLLWSAHDIEALYYLGQALESRHDRERAAEKYRQFLAAWSQACPVPEEVADAQHRLSLLGES